MKHNICMLVSTVGFILNPACSSYFLYSFGASKTFVVWQISEDVETMFRAWRPFCSRGAFFFFRI